MKKIKGILIDVYNKKVEEIEFERSLENFYKLIKCDLVTTAPMDVNNDLVVDDEGLLKNPDHFFSYDKIPLRFGVFSFFLSCFQLKLSKILKNPFVFENPIYDFKKFSGESDIGFSPSASGLDSFVEIE